MRRMKNLPRRDFLKQSALTAGATALPFAAFAQPPQPSSPRPHFPTSDAAWHTTWDAALGGPRRQCAHHAALRPPVLVEGSTYAGIWQECAPQEGLVYGTLAEVRRHSRRPGHSAPDRARQPHGLLRAAEGRRATPGVHQAGRQGGHRRRLRADPDGGADRRNRVGYGPAHRRRSGAARPPPTSRAAAGTRGCASIATRARPVWWRASAPTTPA
jgi:hypothetical protein